METKECYTVWVGGVEVVDYLVDKETADRIAKEWENKGYDDVAISCYSDQQ